MINMPTSADSINEYSGYIPPSRGNHCIERISPNIDPQDFFTRYVVKRKPVILEGHLSDSQWKGHLWTNKYLKEKAGHADVIVEHRGEKDAGFGLMAPKVGMKYGDFLAQLMKGNDRLYLTTQDLERFEEDIDGMGMPKSIIAEPLKSLKSDFPQCPRVLGKLVPYQLTLWQGLTKEGTSSGLHHDYHDNLYVLIRGHKRFRLFPPSAASHMRTSGQQVKIHPNGLIVYKIGRENFEVPVRADGVSKEYLAKEKKVL